jgi:hypothetical protein
MISDDNDDDSDDDNNNEFDIDDNSDSDDNGDAWDFFDPLENLSVDTFRLYSEIRDDLWTGAYRSIPRSSRP